MMQGPFEKCFGQTVRLQLVNNLHVCTIVQTGKGYPGFQVYQLARELEVTVVCYWNLAR